MYFTGTVEKNNTYATTLAGNQQSSPAKNSVVPTKPSDAGMPNDRMRPRLSQGIRIHQIGMIGTPQNGQLTYGRLISPFLGLRSDEQLGQAAHAFLSFRRVAGPLAFDFSGGASFARFAKGAGFPVCSIENDPSTSARSPACIRCSRRSGKSGSCSRATSSLPRPGRASRDSCACSAASRSSSSDA